MAKRHRLLLEGNAYTVTFDETVDEPTEALVTVDDGDALAIEIVSTELPGFISFRAGGLTHRGYVTRSGTAFDVTIGSRRFLIEQQTGSGRERSVLGGAEDNPGEITAPLAGVIVELRAAVGDALEAGATVLILEAMKMQNEVLLPQNGTIRTINIAVGANVAKGVLLVEYEPEYKQMDDAPL
jgi:biotin carboxyl carrier protein